MTNGHSKFVRICLDHPVELGREPKEIKQKFAILPWHCTGQKVPVLCEKSVGFLPKGWEISHYTVGVKSAMVATVY